MNNDRILLSETLDRIGDAVSDIRTAVDMEDNPIEEVADAVEALAEGDGYNAYIADSVDDMLQITDAKKGDWCMVTNNDYQYSSYDNSTFSSVFTFPKTFTYLGEVEEFADVNFHIFSFDGQSSSTAGHVSLTKGGSSSGSSGSGSSGSATTELTFDLQFAGNSYLPSFALTVWYTFNEEKNLWTRNWDLFNQENLTIIGNTVVFPGFGGFFKQGPGVQPLPAILNQAVFFSQRTPFTSTAGTRTFDALYLPATVSLPELPTGWNRLSTFALVDNQAADFGETGFSGSSPEHTAGWNYFYIKTIESERGSGPDIDITYQLISQETGNITYAIKSIVIKDKEGNYLYNLPTFGSAYEGWNCYIYLPDEFIINSTSETWPFANYFFKKADIKTIRTYVRNGSIWYRSNREEDNE